jgi:hypothetical protein
LAIFSVVGDFEDVAAGIRARSSLNPATNNSLFIINKMGKHDGSGCFNWAAEQGDGQADVTEDGSEGLTMTTVERRWTI